MPLYLADASIWIGARHHPGSYLERLLAERIRADEIATCVPVALEVLVGPPDAGALHEAWETLWRNLRWLPLGEAETNRARELLFELAATTERAHRRPALDYLVAACAACHGEVTLWHWDHDLRIICDHADIPHEAEHERARKRGLSLDPREEARRAAQGRTSGS